MSFRIDNQTIEDLKIIGGRKEKDILGIFNQTKTSGATRVLRDMFQNPTGEESVIEKRVRLFGYFKAHSLEFPFQTYVFDAMEHYLANKDQRTTLTETDEGLKEKITNFFGRDHNFDLVNAGVVNTLSFLIDLVKFMTILESQPGLDDLGEEVETLKKVLNLEQLAFLKDMDKVPAKITFNQTADYDEVFRFTIRKDLLDALRIIYNIDVYMAVGNVAKERGFCFAEIEKGEQNIIEMNSVFHPLVENAISNDFRVDENGNLVFLTGANMAGKSTFMKTFGIAVYLAHMGFPIPAKSMRFSPQNGMYTTINLSDNIDQGFSHFYAEVHRLKTVAYNVNQSERLIIIFDELFRGTNVKDAYDATVAVTKAFANKRKCTFVMSTHIIEAGEELKKSVDNIKFVYLPTVMEDNKPKYTYTVTEGITEDRHGMVIINNEGILDILKK